MYNPFEILKIDENCTRAEAEFRYLSLRKAYSEDRFLTGERGAIAAEKLEQLEVAYSDILRMFTDREAKRQYGDVYGEIEDIIRSGDLNRAQQKLDDISSRTAEWHYLQSIVFYKKNWFLESKKQLEFAMGMEPSNQKYKDSLNKLTQKLASNSIPPEEFKTNSSRPASSGVNNGVSPCGGNCCTNLCIADCCCECMGGDLIPCC